MNSELMVMAPSSTSETVPEPDVPEKHKELETEIAQLKLRLRERDRVIFDLEEQIRGKDAIIVDKCQLIERLEQPLYDRFSPEGSIEETSQSTIQYMPLINNIELSVEAKLLEELQEEKNSRAKLVEQNEFLLQQWDEALAYVQGKLKAELQRANSLIDENAKLRKRIAETVVISKSGIQFIALLFVLFSLYLYTWN
ncbi:unnamed protein product [Gongylonema pulchrum]|uniref:Uncharacterized protein n=1 Tax=Gongylonema pulchrum TaxID=637853 RepID=A0A3P6P393_9BILA|nr:unnamed protein product [Gongylonema pulchrum]